MARKIEALFISDVHLGSRGTKTDELLQTLNCYNPQTLYIVGDFIDGWLLKKRHYWPQSHTEVVKKILSYIKHGTTVVYITGNHDEFLRSYGSQDFGSILVVDELVVDGTLIIHGDRFDSIVMSSRWLAILGSVGSDVISRVNGWLKVVRQKLGFRPVSISSWVNEKMLGAYGYLSSFETLLAKAAEEKECHTVICGHMHAPADKMIGSVRYLNCGDWIENFSYLVKDKNGIQLHTKNDEYGSGTQTISHGSDTGF